MNDSCKCINKNTSFTCFAYFYFKCITVFREQDKKWAKSVLNQEHCLKREQKEREFLWEGPWMCLGSSVFVFSRHLSIVKVKWFFVSGGLCTDWFKANHVTLCPGNATSMLLLYCTVLYCIVLYCTVLYCHVFMSKAHFLLLFVLVMHLLVFFSCLKCLPDID